LGGTGTLTWCLEFAFNTIECRCRWKGWGEDDDEWLSEDELGKAQTLLKK
jgi:hypothetical protein